MELNKPTIKKTNQIEDGTLEENQTTNKTERRKVFKEFTENVTMHGFRFIFVGSVMRRLIWFLITSLITGFVVVLFYQLLADFLNQKTISVHDMEFLDNMEFPTVSLCPMNAFKKTHKFPGNLTRDEMGRFFKEVFHSENKSKEFKRVKEKLVNEGFTTYLSVAKLFLNFYNDYARTELTKHLFRTGVEQIKGVPFQPCLFYNQSCDQDDFIPLEYYKQSLCMQFNSYQPGQNGRTVRRTLEEGFALTFDLSSSFKTSVFDGFDLTIVPYGDAYDPTGPHETISIEPGYQTHIKIIQTKVSENIYFEFKPPAD